MREELNIDWDSCLQNENMDENYNTFISKLLLAVDRHIPKISQRKKKHKQSLDVKTVEAVKKKHRCWERFMETKDQNKHAEYVKARNKAKNLVRKAKNNWNKISLKM
ncbi:hypothetical protein KP79_PYT25552 [Mizuhopecten yessoensis]|uniref:Uncharacterized protein n=1 Tax=Mizuhopecten yessoensis TaxID=6573 RepID=A0A210QTV3_MIZYE|nr:hypothetical protein KP79_PYT25552 [Mizuhopecten yessoensis]